MIGPGAEVFHAQSGKEVSYRPISFYADDQAKSGANSLSFCYLEKEIY